MEANTHHVINTEPFCTFLILFGTLGEDVLLARVDAISVEVMRLKEARPELLLGQVVRDVLSVFLLHCKQTE